MIHSSLPAILHPTATPMSHFPSRLHLFKAPYIYQLTNSTIPRNRFNVKKQWQRRKCFHTLFTQRKYLLYFTHIPNVLCCWYLTVARMCTQCIFVPCARWPVHIQVYHCTTERFDVIEIEFPPDFGTTLQISKYGVEIRPNSAVRIPMTNNS